MVGYPISKEGLEREIKYNEGVYKIMENSNVPDTARQIKEHIKNLKARLQALEDKG